LNQIDLSTCAYEASPFAMFSISYRGNVPTDICEDLLRIQTDEGAVIGDGQQGEVTTTALARAGDIIQAFVESLEKVFPHKSSFLRSSRRTHPAGGRRNRDGSQSSWV